MDIFWYLPTQGDERYLGTPRLRRKPTFDYLTQVARAVDHLGFEGMLIGTGTKLDPFTVASALAPLTRRVKFLVAQRPSILTPALSARSTASLDQISNGRILLNIVTGGSTTQLEGDGIFHSHDERYEITDEFLAIWRGVFGEEPFSFEGKHLSIKNGKQQLEPVQKPYPPIYFGGSSDAALEVAAKHVDVYLTWGEPPAEAAQKIQRVRELASQQGRTVRFGVRAYIIVRETDEEAYRVANALIQHVTDEQIERAQAAFAKSESEGQQRLARLYTGDRSNLELHPHLWAGVGLVRGGAGTAFVGSAESVYGLLQEYEALGVDTFVLSGYPALEEAYWTAELLFPLIPGKYQSDIAGEVSGGAQVDASNVDITANPHPKFIAS
ncbi:MAG: alkanesulfonate monooxygenase [Armatimonas sp.]